MCFRLSKYGRQHEALTTLQCCVCVIVGVCMCEADLPSIECHERSNCIRQAFDGKAASTSHQLYNNNNKRTMWEFSCLFIISIIIIGRAVLFSQRHQPIQFLFCTYIFLPFVLLLFSIFTLLLHSLVLIQQPK